MSAPAINTRHGRSVDRAKFPRIFTEVGQDRVRFLSFSPRRGSYHTQRLRGASLHLEGNRGLGTDIDSMGPRSIDTGIAVKREDSQTTTDNMGVVNTATSSTASSSSTTTTTATTAAKVAPPITNGHRQPEENACSDSDDDNQTNNLGWEEEEEEDQRRRPLPASETDKLSQALQGCRVTEAPVPVEKKERNNERGEAGAMSGELREGEVSGLAETLRRIQLAEEREAAAAENPDPAPLQTHNCIQIGPEKIVREEEMQQQEQEQDKGILARGPMGGRAVNHSTDNQYNHIAGKSFPVTAAGMGQPQFQQYGAHYQQQTPYPTSYGMAPPLGQSYRPQGFVDQAGKSKRGRDEGEMECQPYKFSHPTNNLNQPQPQQPLVEHKVLNCNYSGLSSGGKVSVRSDELPSSQDFLARQFSNSDAIDILDMLSFDGSSGTLTEDAFSQPPSSFPGGLDYGDFSPPERDVSESQGSEGQDPGYASDSQGSPMPALSPPPSNMSLDSGISSNSRSPPDGEHLRQDGSSPTHPHTAMSPAHSYMAAASPAHSYMAAASPHSALAMSPANSCSSMGSPGSMALPPSPQGHQGGMEHPSIFSHPPTTPNCAQVGVAGSFRMAGGNSSMGHPAVAAAASPAASAASPYSAAVPATVPSVVQSLLREPNPPRALRPAPLNTLPPQVPPPTSHPPTAIPPQARVKPTPRPVGMREPVECPSKFVSENIENLLDVLETISQDLQENHSGKPSQAGAAYPPMACSPPHPPLQQQQQQQQLPASSSGTGAPLVATQPPVGGFCPSGVMRQQQQQQQPVAMAPATGKVAIQPLQSKASSPQHHHQQQQQPLVVLPPSSGQAMPMGGRAPGVVPVTTTSTPIILIPGASLPSSTIVVVNAQPTAAQQQPPQQRFRTIRPKMPDPPTASKPGVGCPGNIANGKMGSPADSSSSSSSKTAAAVAAAGGSRGSAGRNGSAAGGAAETAGSQGAVSAASRGTSGGSGGSEQSEKQQAHMLNVARRLVASMTKDDLRYKDSDGDTYVHVAVCKADLNMVQALLERLDREGLRDMIDVQNNMRQTPLYLAVSANQDGMVRLFLRYNADVNHFAERVHSDTGEREIKGAIHTASSNGQAWLPTLQALLTSSYLYLDQNNSDGLTALHCAILQHGKHRPDGTRINSIPIIRTLVQAGADPNAQDKKSGKTPMMYALESRDVALIEMLATLVDGKRMPQLMRTQAFDGSTAFRIAESVRHDFAPQDWQRLWALLKQ